MKTTKTSAPSSASEARKHVRHILVVDDHPLVRKGVIALLSQEPDLAVGAEASNRGETLEIIRTQKIDLVILDMVVPGGLGGAEALAKLREVDPAEKAIVCSGYSADPIMAQYERHGFRAVVVKPYDVSELAQAVARATSSTWSCQGTAGCNR